MVYRIRQKRVIIIIGLEYISKKFNKEYKIIAQELDITPQTINSWLRGKRNIPEKRKKQLSEMFYGINPEWFQKELSYDEKAEIEELYLNVKLQENPNDEILQIKVKLHSKEKMLNRRLKIIQAKTLECVTLGLKKDQIILEQRMQDEINNVDSSTDDEETGQNTKIILDRIEKFLETIKINNEDVLKEIDKLMNNT